MAVKFSPVGNDAPFVDANGDPLSGGLLYTYEAGSSTAATTYTTSAGNVANANPIVLSSNGYPASGGSVVGIWLTEGQSYKFVLKTSAGVEVWSRDNIAGINDTNTTQDQWVASGLTPTYVSSTQFTVTGDQTTEFHVGRKLKITDAGGTKYCRITVSAYTTLTTVTVEGDALATPTSAVSYGLVTRTNTSLPAVEDDELIVVDPADPTKRARLDVGGVTAGQTRVLTVPDHNATLPNFPAGFVVPYAGTSAPDGWLFCYGQAVSRTTYEDLFTAISTTYGVGDGSTTFNLPDLRGRVVAGQDDMGGSSANRLTNQTGGVDGDTLGATGGAETHTLTEAQMPAHTHAQDGNTLTNVAGASVSTGNTIAIELGGTTGSTGGGGAHNNVQPTIILNYCIKY